ncbi:MAG: preprotein translocase subunit SecY [Bacteroidales bacterium]|nr:preprotein translocase subunit SecY [Bacteroidales bacterium]MBP5724643.1 preprotein translocase subunit SecY [Bacteroidales bacterium]MBR4498662.1 preprotein translocase subunit SecY [Bacteroidales bacterium]MBR4690754.1 preprotein translocase subunit SecY [Bacteroidales bacterium]MBR7035942.1 preprotein translocase subunit SecY [Bacteroidales bacterium]
MMKFIETIKNIYKIQELRSRILFTLGLILIYRLGSFVVLPGIDPSSLDNLAKQSNEGLLGLINMFSGGAFANASVFALGIMPYISSSIVIQLLGMAIPYFQKLQHEGESGRKKITQITRVLTIFITAAQAPAYLKNLEYQIGADFSGMFWLSSIIIMTAGTMFIMWLGERITDKGVGNGISLIIMIGIIARFPTALFQEFGSRIEGAGGLIVFLIEILMLLVIITLAVLLVQGTRRIPVQYAKRVVGNKQYGGVRQYLPIKVNGAGVMPIIFAQALMFIPLTFAGFSTSDNASSFLTAFADHTNLWYNIVYAVLIIIFTYFYTAITMNPQQISEQLKRDGGFIPGVKPGKKTADFIDNVISRITLPGSIFLAIVAILPAFASLAHVSNQFSYFYGGTSLLIIVGVILDTLQQIESYLLNRHYDGLMKTGRIKGRSGVGTTMI